MPRDKEEKEYGFERDEAVMRDIVEDITPIEW